MLHVRVILQCPVRKTSFGLYWPVIGYFYRVLCDCGVQEVRVDGFMDPSGEKDFLQTQEIGPIPVLSTIRRRDNGPDLQVCLSCFWHRSQGARKEGPQKSLLVLAWTTSSRKSSAIIFEQLSIPWMKLGTGYGWYLSLSIIPKQFLEITTWIPQLISLRMHVLQL